MTDQTSQQNTAEKDCRFSEESTSINLSKWNPMQCDYSSKAFNSYFKPKSVEDFLAIHQSAQRPAAPVESFSPTKGDSQEVNLYISNIPLSLSKEGLRNFLCQAAPITSVRICQSKDPERGTTFGFASVRSPRDAEKVIARFHDFSFGTKSNLRVKLAFSAEERERQREIQREEEEFYMKLYKDSSSSETPEEVMADTTTKNNEMKEDVNSTPSKTEQKGQKGNERLCVCCKQVGSKQCTRCKACYCSVECQRRDWATHQKECLLVGSPATKESSKNNVETKKPSTTSPADISEDSLLIAVDNIGFEENMFYYIDDLKKQEPLESSIRIIIYVVEDLVMKGQVISESDTTALLSLTEKLGDYVTNKPDLFEDGECKEGMLVIIDYLVEISRAAISRCSPGSKEAEIYFIDYGNKETCKLSDLKPLPEFALSLPMQCREFTLHQMPNDVQTFLKEPLSQHLKELVLEKPLVAEVKSSENGCHTLIIGDEARKININKSMLALYEELSAKSAKSHINGPVKSSEEGSKEGRNLSTDIPLEPLPKESDFKIVVTDVQSPEFFFAQIVSADLANLTELANISERLQELPSSGTSGVKLKEGQTCVALFPEDQMWYRASILRVNEDETVRVCYFDYGNTADIDTCFLRPISDEFIHLPKQARKFSLAGIQPSSSDGFWSKEAVNVFKEKTSQEPCEVLCVGTSEGVCQVKLYVSSEDCCADEILMNLGYAKSKDENMKSHPSVAAKETSDLRPADKNQFFLTQKTIKANEELRVAVVHVEDPYRFYVNIIDREAIETLMGYSALLHEMELVQLKNPTVGDACCALYSDGDWYRAKILSTKKDSCMVFFSDYGNESEISNESLKVMPEEVRSLPAQAVKVKLHDVSPVPESDEWSKAAKELFSGLISDKICKMKVNTLEKDATICSLVCEDDDTDVSEKIIKAGVAVSIPKRDAQNQQQHEIKKDHSRDSKLEIKQSNSLSAVKSSPGLKSASMNQFSLTPKKVIANEELRVAVVHVEDPYCFYVNVIDREAIEILMSYSALLHELKLTQLENPNAGDACCALYSDGDWYRAKILSTNKDSCIVFFSDYGNESEISNESLKVMPEEVRSLPAQAVKVKLHNVLPVSGSNAWSSSEKDFFSGLISDKICKLKVISLENNVAVCSLVCEDDGIDVIEEIVKAGVAISASKPQPQYKQQHEIKSDEPKDSHIEIKQSNSSSAAQRRSEHKPLNGSKFSLTPKEINADEELRVAVVHVEDPYCFYVNVIDREAIETLMSYSAFLHELKLTQLENPNAGDACCALYSDGDWYRAKILSTNKDSCIVFFSDYGNESEILNESLKVIPEEVRSLPAQAVKVKLHNVSPVSENDEWSTTAKEFFSGLISDKICKLMVNSKEGDTAVCSLVCEDDLINVAEEIVKAGVATSVSSLPEKKEVIQYKKQTKAADIVKETNIERSDCLEEKVAHTKSILLPQEKDEKSGSDVQSGESSESDMEANKYGMNGFGRGNKFKDQVKRGSSESQRGRGRGYNNFRSKNRYLDDYRKPPKGSYASSPYPPYPVWAWYPPNFGFFPHPGMPHPYPPYNNEQGSKRKSEEESGGDSQNEYENGPPLMPSYAMPPEFRNMTGGFRGRGGRGGRGGSSRNQNGFQNMSFKSYQRLPQEKIPDAYFSGANIEFIVSSAATPSRFYIVEEKNQGTDKLSSTTYERESAVASVEEGMVCAAFYEGHYYRAVVERVYPDSVSVRLADSGKQAIAKKSTLKRLTAADFKKPFIAVKCVLYNVCGKGKHKWSESANQYFKHKISITGGKMKGLVRGAAPSGLMVSIVDPENSKEFLVDDLVKQGFAFYMHQQK